MENYIYPLVVCEEEGKILFFNSATQQVLGEDELLGRSLPESWKEVDTPVPIPGETPDTTELVTIIWQDILWDGNVAWYGVAVPAGGGGPTPPAADELGEAQQLRSKLEESQEMAALQADELRVELQQSREMAAAESEALRAKLERAMERAQEADQLREQLEAAQSKAQEAEELREKLDELLQLEEEAEQLRNQLARSQATEQEADELRASLAQSQLAMAEVEELRARLDEAEKAAAGGQALQERLDQAEASADEVEELRAKLEQSVEMAAVELEKREAAEGERDKLEAKLRDLHQRSISKLEAAKTALESERAERNELSERLARLKAETEELRQQLEEKAIEVEEVRNQSGEQFQRVRDELVTKMEALSERDRALADKSEELQALEARLAQMDRDLQAKVAELEAAEQKAERYRSEYEELDKEMVASQERSALLTAKLQSVESRMERYQRLMDRQPNEFARGGDAEAEVERLQSRVEELEVELAATSAAARSRSEGAEGDDLSHLEEECRKLKDELVGRERRIQDLEEALASAKGADGTSHAEATARGEGDASPEASALLEELRFHRELEYQEARDMIRHLQERCASLKVDGVDPQDSGPREEEFSELQSELAATKEQLVNLDSELKLKRQATEQIPLLQRRIVELEEQLEQASQGGGSNDESRREMGLRLAELEQELQKARSEASPEELQLARRRISELEAHLAAKLEGSGGGDAALKEKAQQMEVELAKAREQLQEMNNELRRTLEGDRETKKLAYADQLTGLPNLNLTGQYLQVCFERSGRGEGALALILIDLDHFRRVNDALGQKSGDELLKQVGARLQRVVTEKDTAIARRGEDEFMVVAFMENARVDGEALLARVRGIAHNLLNELAKPFEVKDQKVQVTASLGVALYPGPARDRTELLEQSEHAMYKAKEAGRARVNFYTEEIHNIRERRKYLEQELRQAINMNQFGLLYQPIYDLSTSKAVGVEALLRWNHPTRGMLEPADFLEVAEDSGLIVQIGDLAVQEALSIAKQKFMKRKFLSLNLSFRQLIDSGFAQRFMKHLQMAGVPPHEVIVEVSEKTTRIDPDRVKNTLAHLAHWGVGIGLDDYGTGSSELNQLTELNLRVLKIDTSIIGKLPDDRGATKLCQAIIALSQALEIPVLAEGVETREQLALMGKFGCKYAQGLILNSPMNVSQLIQVM